MQELNDLRSSMGIDKIMMKPVKRNYCFEREDVPRGESDFIKIKYSARCTYCCCGFHPGIVHSVPPESSHQRPSPQIPSSPPSLPARPSRTYSAHEPALSSAC